MLLSIITLAIFAVGTFAKESIVEHLRGNQDGAIEAAAHPQACRDGWTYYANHCYLILPEEEKSRTSCNAHCASLDASMLCIENLEQNDWIGDMYYAATSELTFWSGVWIGYSDTAAEGAFQWNAGCYSTFTNWMRGEPNDNGSGEDFVTIVLDGSYQWNDIYEPYRHRDGQMYCACQTEAAPRRRYVDIELKIIDVDGANSNDPFTIHFPLDDKLESIQFQMNLQKGNSYIVASQVPMILPLSYFVIEAHGDDGVGIERVTARVPLNSVTSISPPVFLDNDNMRDCEDGWVLGINHPAWENNQPVECRDRFAGFRFLSAEEIPTRSH